MDKTWKKLLALAGGLGAVGAVCYYLSKDEPNPKPTKQFSESEIFEIMKYLKGQLYTVWIQVADIRNKVVSENNNSTVMNNGQNIRDILGTQTRNLITQKQKLVCIKYDISEEDLEKYVDYIYISNKKIQDIQQEITTCFNDSIDGVKPKFNISNEVVEYLSQNRVLYLYEKILRECGQQLVGLYREMNQEGITDLSLSNQTFVRRIKSLKLGEKKTKILTDNGVNFPDEPNSPTSILTKIRYKYQQENDEFNEKITALDKKYEELMDKLNVGVDTNNNNNNSQTNINNNNNHSTHNVPSNSSTASNTVLENNSEKYIDPTLCETVFGSQEQFELTYKDLSSQSTANSSQQ